MNTFNIYKSYDGRVLLVREGVISSGFANVLCLLYNKLYSRRGEFYYYK